MANEYKLVGYAASATVTVQLLDDVLVASGAATALTETPAASGNYLGSVPGGISAGVYVVTFLDGGIIVAQGELQWDGAAEIPPGGDSITNNQTISGSNQLLKMSLRPNRKHVRTCT